MSITVKSGSSTNLLTINSDGSLPVTMTGGSAGARSNNSATVADFQSVLPAVATTAAPSYTTGNTVALSTDLSGNLRVSATGTVAATQSGTWNVATVTTLTSITNAVTVAQATAANLNATIQGNQGNNTATAGTNNLGTLPAVATTAAPTYTTGNQVSLSVDTAGSLRVVNIGTSTVSGTVTANAGTGTFAVSGTVAATQSGTWNVQNQFGGVAASTGTGVSGTGVQRVVLATDQPTVATTQTMPASLVHNQTTVGTSAVALGASAALTVGVVVRAQSTNTASVFVGVTGVTTSTGYEMQAGESLSLTVANVATVFVISTAAGQKVSYIGN